MPCPPTQTSPATVIVKGTRVRYTVMYNDGRGAGRKHIEHRPVFGRVTRLTAHPRRGTVARIAVEHPEPGATRYVMRAVADLQPASHPTGEYPDILNARSEEEQLTGTSDQAPLGEDTRTQIRDGAHQAAAAAAGLHALMKEPDATDGDVLRDLDHIQGILDGLRLRAGTMVLENPPAEPWAGWDAFLRKIRDLGYEAAAATEPALPDWIPLNPGWLGHGRDYDYLIHRGNRTGRLTVCRWRRATVAARDMFSLLPLVRELAETTTELLCDDPARGKAIAQAWEDGRVIPFERGERKIWAPASTTGPPGSR